MSRKWYYLDKGKRPGEVIVACYIESGLTDKVASAYYDARRGTYKLYPTRYKGFDTIEKPTEISLFDYISQRKKDLKC